jgi:hypothetical protein
MSSTYHEISDVRNQAGRQDIEQASHAELSDLGEVYEIVALGEKSGGDDAEQTTHEKYEGAATLARLGLEFMLVFEDSNSKTIFLRLFFEFFRGSFAFRGSIRG